MPTAAIAYWRPRGGFLSFPLFTGFDIGSSIHTLLMRRRYFGALKYQSVAAEGKRAIIDVDIVVDNVPTVPKNDLSGRSVGLHAGISKGLSPWKIFMWTSIFALSLSVRFS